MTDTPWYQDLTGVGQRTKDALLIPVLAVVTALLIGGLIIALTDVDILRMWADDPWEAFKETISSVLGASVTNVVIALAIAATPHTARVVRASVMVVREMEYVEAARALGAGHVRILLRHVLANAMAPLVVRVTYVFAVAILNEAVLSFIGVGPPPPTPTFGAIIANGRDFIVAAPWITVAPGLAILVSVLGLNMLGDGLRDVLDPRMRVNVR